MPIRPTDPAPASRRPLLGLLACGLLAACGGSSRAEAADGGGDGDRPGPAGRIERAAERADFTWFGLSVATARQQAEAIGSPFRVVEEDGEQRLVTMDHRPGRINASVVADRIVAVQIEGQPNRPVDEGAASLDLLPWLGLEEASAAALAAERGRAWRVVLRDGTELPTSRDHDPDRLNAVIVDGRVRAVFGG